MKSQLNEYYQCNDKGYVKIDNVKVDHLPIISEIPISARCNQILPYKLHKLQIMDPVEVSSVKFIPNELKEIPAQPPSLNAKKQTSLNYSFSVSSLANNPIKMLQKDEVRSIHIDDKTSARTKIEDRDKDLTKSTFTSLNKPMVDMKRSLFETNQSFYTNDTSNKDNQKLDMIVNQLVKEKKKCQEFQKKYEILFNLVNKQKITQSQEGYQQSALSPQQTPNSKYTKYTKYTNSKRHLNVKSVTESSEESQAQSPVMINYGRSKSKRKCSSPIIINLGSEILSRSPLKNQHKNPQSDEQLSDLNEIKGSLELIQNQVSVLHENLEFLQKKIDQQQMRRQKQALLQQLRDKQQRIQQMAKQNQKIKQINELLVTKRSEPQKSLKSQYSVNLKFDKNTILTSFIITLLMTFIFLTLRGTICE